jgi:hypothetical protein
MTGALLLLATLLLPMGMAMACISGRLRARMTGWLALAPLPGLAAALLAVGGPPLVLDADGARASRWS